MGGEESKSGCFDWRTEKVTFSRVANQEEDIGKGQSEDIHSVKSIFIQSTSIQLSKTSGECQAKVDIKSIFIRYQALARGRQPSTSSQIVHSSCRNSHLIKVLSHSWVLIKRQALLIEALASLPLPVDPSLIAT